jgi:hypothetical protein
MRKPIAITALVSLTAFAVVVAIAGAVGNNVSTLNGSFKPNTGLSATVPTKGGLFVETTTLDDSDTGTPTAPSGPQPSPTTNVKLNLDDDLVFAPTSVPSCNANLAGTTTQAALIACGASQIGGGVATLCVNNAGSCLVFQAVVTAFNGPKDAQNRPTILLHGRNDATGITTVLKGTLKTSTAGADFGKVLDVPVPLIAGGSASITDFAVNVTNGTFVRATCSDTNLRLNYRAVFTYLANPSDTVNDAQVCSL